MLEANPIHIWKLQTKANLFQHVSNFFQPFCVFYRPDENNVIKSFFINNSSSETGRMFILHTIIKNYKIYLLAKFQSDYLIFVYLTGQNDFHVLVSKICSANRNNLKLSQLGDFIMPSQS